MGGALSSLQVDFKRQIQNLIWMEMVRKQTEKKRSEEDEGFLWDFLLGASACFSHYLSPTHPTSLFPKRNGTPNSISVFTNYSAFRRHRVEKSLKKSHLKFPKLN